MEQRNARTFGRMSTYGKSANQATGAPPRKATWIVRKMAPYAMALSRSEEPM